MEPAKSRYIVSPIYDWIFFIGSPIWTCGVGYAFLKFFERGYPEQIHFWGHEASITAILALTQAHLAAVFYRSHGNPQVFRQFPWRFTVVPVLLFASIWLSKWVMAICGFVVVFWDVYHTSQQNFGLARIYDARSGRALPTSRWPEKIFHLIFYACPIFAGSYLMAHIMGFHSFNDVHLYLLGKDLPAWFEREALLVKRGVISIGLTAVALFTIFEIRRHKSGYQYPFPKLMIFITTMFCSIFAWGFNKFGDAYFIVNMFHAVQYFALVWATEHKQRGTFLAYLANSYGKILAFLAFAIPPIALGSWFEFNTNNHLAVALLLTCALLHFWYDGFIWSVRKKSV